jgi:hypothetical protein
MDNGVNDKLLAYLEDEIIKNYKIKDWSKFDYLRVEPRPVYYYWLIGIMVLTQVGLYLFFHANEFEKQHYEYFHNRFSNTNHFQRNRQGAQGMGSGVSYLQSHSSFRRKISSWIQRQAARLRQGWRNIVNALSRH